MYTWFTSHYQDYNTLPVYFSKLVDFFVVNPNILKSNLTNWKLETGIVTIYVNSLKDQFFSSNVP